MWFWFFCLSLAANLFLLFYVRWLLKAMAAINIDMENLSVLVSSFGAHVKSVYELEMFYGDQTLEALLKHANELSSSIENLDLVLNESEERTPEEKEVAD